MTEVAGDVASGWELVADAFRTNFERGLELGAACCVYCEGRPVVDVWGGTADSRSGRPWQEDTVATVFSTTKGATAICAHILAEREDLNYDAPVAGYWPQFAANGKEQIKVRWLLSHQAGLPAVDARLSLAEVCTWDPVVRALEAQKPYWRPGEHHLYHAVTYGFLVGEVVRRITGKSLGRFFADEVAAPLGLAAWIGTPEEVEPRVAHLVMDPPPADPDAALAARFERLGVDAAGALAAAVAVRESVLDPGSVAARSRDIGGALPGPLVSEEGGYNARMLRAAELPSSNMIGDARSLARMYAATVGVVDGIRLLRPETVEAACVVQTSGSTRFHEHPGTLALDAVLDFPIALGFMRPSPVWPLLGARSFGHPGAGGSIGFADPDAQVGFGYVMNRLSSDVNDPRAPALIEAVASCLYHATGRLSTA